MTNLLERIPAMAERDAEIRRLLEAGWSHAAVAQRYGVERQRIQQVAARLGLGPVEVLLTPIPGGYAVTGGEGTDEEAIRARIETALRTAKLEMRFR